MEMDFDPPMIVGAGCVVIGGGCWGAAGSTKTRSDFEPDIRLGSGGAVTAGSAGGASG
jgi:hypothetical protein